jgi:hypothetical protein
MKFPYGSSDPPDRHRSFNRLSFVGAVLCSSRDFWSSQEVAGLS